MLASVRTLFDRAIDYAGLFPPASLGVKDALTEYAAARRGPESWLVNRFVIRLDHLVDFERLFEPLAREQSGKPWALSVIIPAGATPPFERVEDFNERWTGYASIVSMEFAPIPASRIQALAEPASAEIEVVFETPVDADLDSRLREINEAGAAAKIRTGGVTPDTVPPADAVARFLRRAHEERVAFKATAGLHHALRGVYPLTYEANATTAAMHGFLNLAVAAAIVNAGGSSDDTTQILSATSADVFEFSADGLQWNNRTISCEALADTRRTFFRSFGSCSIREPVDELRRLRLL